MKFNQGFLRNYVDNRQSQGFYWFSAAKAIESLKMTPEAFRAAASRLSSQCRIRRVWRDFYVIVPLEYRAMKVLPCSWFVDDLMQYKNLDYYVGLLTAASIYGASHQQSTLFQIISTKQIRPIIIANQRMEFYSHPPVDERFIELHQTETGTMRVSCLELTVYDLVRYVAHAGNVHNVATILAELADVEFDEEKLIDFIESSNVKISVVQRLGYLLEMSRLALPLEKLSNLVQHRASRYQYLVPEKITNEGFRNAKWKLIINEQLEPDL